MIVAMKKATIIVEERDSQQAVTDLRRLGVMHIEHQQPAQAADAAALQDDVGLATAAIDVFRKADIRPHQTQAASALSDWKPKARHLIELGKRYEHLEAYSRTLRSHISEWEPWGDFNPREITQLGHKGIFVKLYEVPSSRLDEFPDGVIAREIRRHAGTSFCAAISRSAFEAAFKEVPLPHHGLLEMRRRLDEDAKVMVAIREEIVRESSFYQELLPVLERLHTQIEFVQVVSGMAKEGAFTYLSGFVPVNSVDALSRQARTKEWGIVLEDPGDDDTVPTLLSNPRWVAVISPVFKLLEIVPGYRELDISPFFLCFLSLFFGMIIADAGYGAVYFLLALFAQKKFGHKMSDQRIFFLLYIFSSCAILWGLLTGTVFGQEWYLKAGFKSFAPLLNDTKFLQTFCFFIGAVHLTLAHAWQALRKFPSPAALCDIGWISVLWAAFFLARTLILDDPFPSFGKWLVISGVSLVILFTSPQKNIFKMIAQGLGNVATSLMNNFTDIVSYIRLFAIGLAGVAIADTVNSLAAAAGGGPVAQGAILFVGHTINIILGPMSVLVHGIRLNVLEFSGHVGLSWSGVAYKPFKE